MLQYTVTIKTDTFNSQKGHFNVDAFAFLIKKIYLK